MEPLQDPRRQIRLLHLIPGAEDDDISCEMDVHDFDMSTPKYLAISYTWGDREYPRAIFIDDNLRMVRQNCQYALWQARYHYPGAYVWIDAICIDQGNLEEKSRQVAMMSEIFGRATEVLACVGPDYDDSEFLWTFSQEFTYQALRPTHKEAFTFVMMNSYSREGISCEQLWDHWENSNSSEILERFLKACGKFTNRPYWERVWILQEVGMARAKKVFCGRLCLSWMVTRNLLLLRKLKRAQALFKFSCEAFGTVSGLLHHFPVMDETFITQFRQFKCEDVRDRFFATQVLRRFHDIQFHIEPDYSRCALDLAMTIMRRNVPWTYTSNLLCMLEINMNCPEFQALVVQRSNQKASMILKVSPDYHMRLTATRLRKDENGRLTCSLQSLHASHRDLAMLDFITSASNDRTLDEMLSKCVRVYAGDEPVIFLGKETREGDYLAEVEWPTGLYFVLRRRSGNTFHIVSQGFSLMSHNIGRVKREKCDCATRGIAHNVPLSASFATSLSAEDVVIFAGQDLLDCDENYKLQHDPIARLRRLITPVSSRPRPIAIMKHDDCGNGIKRVCRSVKKLWKGVGRSMPSQVPGTMHQLGMTGNDSESVDDSHDRRDEANSDGASKSDDSLEPANLEDSLSLAFVPMSTTEPRERECSRQAAITSATLPWELV